MNVKRITPVMLTYAAQSEWIWRHYLTVFLVFPGTICGVSW